MNRVVKPFTKELERQRLYFCGKAALKTGKVAGRK